jgi:hypothetical protein
MESWFKGGWKNAQGSRIKKRLIEKKEKKTIIRQPRRKENSRQFDGIFFINFLGRIFMKHDTVQKGRIFETIGGEAVYLRINQLQKGLF